MISKKLLFVEDNVVAAETLKSFLSNRFDHVAVVSSGEEAYEMFKEEPFDILITDLHLPRMNGFELVKKVKHISPQTKVFIISAYNTDSNAKEAKAVGAEKFLLKPLDLDVLESVIKSAISS